MPSRREATTEELRTLSGDLRSLVHTATTDPRVQRRKEIGWRVLYGGLAAGTALVARKLATRTWGVVTGELPPPVQKGHVQNGRGQQGQTVPGATEGHPKVTRRSPEVPLPYVNRGAGGNGSEADTPLADEAPQDQPQPQPERAEPKVPDPEVTDFSKADWKAVLIRAAKETLDDNVPMLAQALAYSTFFAIPSVLLVVVGLFTLISGPDTITSLMEHFRTIMPGDATRLLNESLQRLESRPSTGLLMTIVGLVLAVWSTVGAMNALMTALNIAYDRKDRRPFAKKKIVGLEMAACIGLAFLLISVLLIFGPAIQGWVGNALDIEPALGWVWWIVQWPLLVVGLLAAFATVYWLGPDVDQPRWTFLTPGAAVALVIWLGASGLFAVYTSMFGSYNKTWGSLAAVIVMLTWLWITGLALLFGGEVNAEVERTRELRKGTA
jgi:membrane protein